MSADSSSPSVTAVWQSTWPTDNADAVSKPLTSVRLACPDCGHVWLHAPLTDGGLVGAVHTTITTLFNGPDALPVPPCPRCHSPHTAPTATEPGQAALAKAQQVWDEAHQYDAFHFHDGAQAPTIGAFRQHCHEAPDVAAKHLMAGHFEPWLHLVGLHDWAEVAISARRQAPSPRVALQRFLAW